jgi:hypothetical protein
MADNKLSTQEIHPGLGSTENVEQLLHNLVSSADQSLGDVNQDLAPNIERKEGKGTLVSGSGDRIEVVFVLRVWNVIVGASGSARVKRQYQIWITALGGKQVPDGSYELLTGDEILNIRKQIKTWQVLAP